MVTSMRTAAIADAESCGRVIYAAFQGLADHHRFPRDFPSADIATELATMLLTNPAFHGVVAEEDGRLVGCNFIELRPPVAGIGPIVIEPTMQNRGLGRSLMQAVIDRAATDGISSIRLAQAAYHNRSLCLYTRLGFQSRGSLSVMQGPTLNARFPGYDVRPAAEADVTECNQLCRTVHGFDRGGGLRDAIGGKTAVVVEHLGRITGYATGIGFFAHAVADSNQGLKALIGASPSFTGPGFLLPTQNHDVLRWCLDSGLRLVMQMTSMTIGLYSEPCGAWLPSVLY